MRDGVRHRSMGPQSAQSLCGKPETFGQFRETGRRPAHNAGRLAHNAGEGSVGGLETATMRTAFSAAQQTAVPCTRPCC